MHRPADASHTISWESSIQKLYNIKTVETFWQLHGSLQPPSKLPKASSYYLFRDDTFPAWEHPLNKEGGIWTLQFNSSSEQHMDDIWQKLSMACIGEAFESPHTTEHSISGIEAAPRRPFGRVVLWTRTCDPDTCMAIGRKMKSLLAVKGQAVFRKHNSKTHIFVVDDGDAY